MPAADLLSELEVFFGDASTAEARVYARMVACHDASDCRLSGAVIGPQCDYARTLSTTVPLVDIRQISTKHGANVLLAEAIVPDPCFWSAEVPLLYLVEVELWRG